MDFINNNKGTILAVIVFAAVVLGYHYLAPTTDSVATNVATTGPGQTILSLYGSLETVTLDQSLFSSPGYKALTDFSTDVPAQSAGRSNPFDPI